MQHYQPKDLFPSADAFDLIRTSEGYRSRPYRIGQGKWTVGYGHELNGVPPKQITRANAEKLLKGDVAHAAAVIRHLVTIPLTQGQFDALVSFVFNVGGDQFDGSTMLTALNKGDYAYASAEFGRWIWDNGKQLKGLIERRKRERELFDGVPWKA